MVLGFTFFEGFPLARVKEAVVVGKVYIVTDQSKDLSLPSEWIIANNDGKSLLQELHSMYCELLIT
jgi:hypothetical protein